MSPRISGKDSKAEPKRRDPTSLELAVASFAACPRCSFFLSSYRLVHGDFDEAVSASRSGWLELEWDAETRRLIHKSYGGRIDLDAYHYEGICSVCRRAYIYDQPDDERESASFRIEINPG